MTILITGGAGFIGSAVVPELQRADHDVYILDNLSFGSRRFIEVADDHFFEVDLRDQAGVAQVVQQVQPEWIVHLAAVHFIPFCNQHPYEAFDINVKGTLNLWDAAAACDSVQKVFFASTAAVYPIYDDPIHEEKPLGPLDVYGLSKLTGERLTHEFFLKTGIDSVVCRFFNAFGPNETNPHLIPEIQDQVNKGLRTIQLGNLDPKRDFIHTSDMARAVRMLMETDVKGYDTFNLGRGIEYSVREVVEAFGRQVGETIQIEQDPKRTRKTDRMHLLADISKLKAATGWAPQVSLDEGIATLVGTEAYQVG